MKKFLAVALILALAIPVYAGAAVVTPMADSFFQSYSVTLSDTSTGIHIVFRVNAVETSDTLGAPSYDVQRYSGGTWSTVASGLSGSTGSDTASYTFSKNYTCASGYSYRVKARFYCKKYNGTSSTVTVTSSSIAI
jgi:ABC-type uncharacterized transport system permease subunit